MEQSVGGPLNQAPRRPQCSHCGKPGHKEEKCWVKNPELKAPYIEKRYGRKTKKGKDTADEIPGDTNENPTFDLPIRAAGLSGTQQPSISKPHNKGTPPRVINSKNSTKSPKKQLPSGKSKQELAYFGPSQTTSSSKASNPTSIDDLPDELVLKILEHFDPCQHVAIGEMFNGDSFPQGEVFADRTMLKNLCRSSRRLYNITRPILGRLVTDNGLIQQRQKLIRRFIDNPIAASHVRAIFVEGYERRPVRMKFIGIGQQIRSAAERIDIEGKEQWVQHMQDGGTDAKVAMLLSLLPKLEILHLKMQSDLGNDFPWTLALMRRAAEKSLPPGQGPFSSLKTIWTAYACEGIDPGFSPMGLACAMGLPTLQHISVYLAWGNSMNEYHKNQLVSKVEMKKRKQNSPWKSEIHWRTAISNVETLEFEESVVDSEYLRNIITACKALRNFTYKWPMELDLEGSESDVGFSGLVETLSTQKHSLEMLTLDSSDVEWFGRFEHPNLKPIGSLVDFTKLHTLELSGEHIIGGIPMTNVFGDSDSDSDAESPTYTVNGRPLNYAALADIFPPSIETLVINASGQSVRHIMPLVVEIARACKMEKRLPNLKKVDLENWLVDESGSSHQALLDQATGFFKDAGIEFVPPEFMGSQSDMDHHDVWGYGESDDEYGPPSDYSGDSYDYDDYAGMMYFP